MQNNTVIKIHAKIMCDIFVEQNRGILRVAGHKPRVLPAAMFQLCGSKGIYQFPVVSVDSSSRMWLEIIVR